MKAFLPLFFTLETDGQPWLEFTLYHRNRNRRTLSVSLCVRFRCETICRDTRTTFLYVCMAKYYAIHWPMKTVEMVYVGCHIAILPYKRVTWCSITIYRIRQYQYAASWRHSGQHELSVLRVLFLCWLDNLDLNSLYRLLSWCGLLKFSPIQINVTKLRLEGKWVWFLFVQRILASITVVGYREHDQDGGSMIKVYTHCLSHLCLQIPIRSPIRQCLNSRETVATYSNLQISLTRPIHYSSDSMHMIKSLMASRLKSLQYP